MILWVKAEKARCGFVWLARLAVVACLAAPIPLAAEEGKKPPVEEIKMGGIPLIETVRATLRKQPAILIQEEQTVFQDGVRQFESGRFDTVLQSALARRRDVAPLQEGTAALLGTSRQITETTDSTLSIQKQFRNGIIAGPQAALSGSNVTADNLPQAATAKVNFRIEVPLLRGLGEQATGAREKAAERDYRASLAQLRFTASQNVLNTVTAYWNYLAAQKNLEIFIESEKRARFITEETQKLVDGGEQPAANMDQLRANLADKIASRLRSEQSLIEARVQLGLAMGVADPEIQALPLPADEFPENPGDPYPGTGETQQLVKISLEKRQDLLALKLGEESAKILLAAARNGLLHRLDVNMSGGYTGLEEGTGVDDYLGSIDENISGGNFLAAVRYEWPFANSAARGLFLQSKAAYEQSRLRVYDLSRTIASQVAVASSALKRTSEELDRSHESYQLYFKAVKSEREKQRLGMSTLIDVIDIEDRLISTRLNHVSGQQRYAVALAQLRFQTGTLVDSSQETGSVSLAALTTVPAAGEIK